MSTMLCSSRNKKKDGGEQIIISTTAAPAKMRKGPWTDEEDEQLVRFVRLFGERRWDFLAKVSGLRGGGCIDRSIAVDPFVPMHLHEEEDRATRSIVSIDGLRRTGKSCRLRWVNYLHPGLRRGRITVDEERLIVELHAQWGSRWSRIARSFPGRTDNEIKNFWRTRTRKKALEERRAAAAAESSLSPSSSVTSDECLGSPNSASGAATSSSQREGISGGGGDGDDAELEEASTAVAHEQHPQPQPQECYGYTMDQLWNEIAAADEAAMSYVVDACSAGGHYYGAAAEPPPSPVWEFCSDYSLWRIDDEEYYKKMLDSS